MKKHVYVASCMLFLAVLTTCALPVFALLDPPGKTERTRGSGKVTCTPLDDPRFVAPAEVTFKIIDDNIHGDSISFKYSDSAGHSFTLGLPIGVDIWDSTNILASVQAWRTEATMAAVGKITSTSDSSWLELNTLILFTIYDDGVKGSYDYVQLWVGIPYSFFPWDPISPSGQPPLPNWPVTKGKATIAWPPL